MTHHQVVIVGGGIAGLAVSDRLVKQCPGLDIAIIEPQSQHDNQRLWTMVGAGVLQPEYARRDKAELIPEGVTWIHDSVVALYPGYNAVATSRGADISYDYLVVAPGIQVNWDRVVGLRESVGKGGVCSVYSHATAASTWDFIRGLWQGNALFTHPSGSIKCMSGSQQMCYLADEHFRREGIRDQMRLIFLSGAPKLFPIPEYCELLEEVAAEKGVETHLGADLIEIRPTTKEAIFRRVETGEELVLRYGLLHVAPPMGPLDVFANSELAGKDGWVDVDRQTLQHVRFPNVFGLGDASSVPTVKTGAAAAHQAPVVVSNLVALMEGRPMTAKYSGFTACSVAAGYGQLLMAEFDYSQQPTPGTDVELLDLTRFLKSPGKPAN